MQYETKTLNAAFIAGGYKSVVVALAVSLSFIAVPSRAEEAAPRGTTARASRADSEGSKTDTRMVIVQKDGELRIELQQIWERREDTASLEAFVRDLQSCREQPGAVGCDRVSGVEEVLRSPELYGMYVGMLAGAFAAGFCAVRPEDCVEPFTP